ncbi:MAG: UDP-2,3-diacylglucosamine diphosphatase LpxI [Magnetococcales bacterium]|nr:UDP-2,3-diacylglucosamine diphosphatase LpxI [Magnetococcales bacterium]
MASRSATVGLVAGAGTLPLLLARRLRAQGRRVAAAAIEGHADPALNAEVDAIRWVKLGQFKKVLEFLQRQSAGEAVFIGGIGKSSLWRIRPDALAIRLALRLPNLHDDVLLRAIAGEVERLGVVVRGVTDFLPELLAPPGVMTARAPSPEEWEEIRFGWFCAKELGRLDIGQGVVVRQKVVVAVEAMEGTDAMIARAGGLLSGGLTLGRRTGPSGVLIKTAKPQQDHRLDLPTIGARTIEGLIRAGIRTAAVEAGAVMVVDPQTALALADRHEMAVVALSDGPDGGWPAE